ncbi:glutathione synthetase, putative [Eimeria tenella]|uniref:Glutathione synthetase, putative n=1 Tax=Eimeria tenella TaxID=5802 RepID=U6L296_EIMTE|nr:glutathione synthetase, putative [Eimeria tenella]CDJ44301.1 glutathione synthetase, putative [Eimeria tenella]|eukprot:XP_013235050.1 glutathione synthetase, putative [Eimeria tenella]
MLQQSRPSPSGEDVLSALLRVLSAVQLVSPASNDSAAAAGAATATAAAAAAAAATSTAAATVDANGTSHPHKGSQHVLHEAQPAALLLKQHQPLEMQRVLLSDSSIPQLLLRAVHLAMNSGLLLLRQPQQQQEKQQLQHRKQQQQQQQQQLDQFAADLLRARIAPFLLLPSPFPFCRYKQALSVAPHFNRLIDNITTDPQWLLQQLQLAAAHDSFLARLLRIMQRVYISSSSSSKGAPRSIQKDIRLHLLRTDFMLDTSIEQQQQQQHPAAAAATESAAAAAEEARAWPLRLVEVNTIAVSFAGLSQRVSELHRHLPVHIMRLWRKWLLLLLLPTAPT